MTDKERFLAAFRAEYLASLREYISRLSPTERDGMGYFAAAILSLLREFHSH